MKKKISGNRGIIRPGQKTIYRKATLEEQEERIEFLAEEIRKNPLITKYQMRELMAKRYKIHWRTTDEIYIVRAHKLLDKESAMTSDQARKIGLNKVISLLSRSKNEGIQLKAEERLAKIKGYEAPTKHALEGKIETELSGSVTQKSEIDLEKLDLDVPTLRKVLEAIRKVKQRDR